MARTGNNTNRNNVTTRQRDYLKVDSWAVERVRESRDGNNVYFTLILNGVTINNCRIGHTQDGRDFISMPQYRGSDGNYYSVVYASLSTEVQNEILEAIRDELN